MFYVTITMHIMQHYHMSCQERQVEIVPRFSVFLACLLIMNVSQKKLYLSLLTRVVAGKRSLCTITMLVAGRTDIKKKLYLLRDRYNFLGSVNKRYREGCQ